MTVVNDPAERGVKLVQEYIDSTNSEELRQDLMPCWQWQKARKKFPGKGNL